MNALIHATLLSIEDEAYSNPYSVRNIISVAFLLLVIFLAIRGGENYMNLSSHPASKVMLAIVALVPLGLIAFLGPFERDNAWSMLFDYLCYAGSIYYCSLRIGFWCKISKLQDQNREAIIFQGGVIVPTLNICGYMLASVAVIGGINYYLLTRGYSLVLWIALAGLASAYFGFSSNNVTQDDMQKVFKISHWS